MDDLDYEDLIALSQLSASGDHARGRRRGAAMKGNTWEQSLEL